MKLINFTKSLILILVVFSVDSVCFARAQLTQTGEYIVFSVRAPSGSDVKFASSLTGWESEDQLAMSEVSYGFYSLALPTPWLYGVFYKFVINGKWTHDLENTLKEYDGHEGWNSVLEIPFEETELLEEPPFGQSWLEQELEVKVSAKEKRKITVLSPSFLKRKNLRTIYFLDGGDYLNRAYISRILANYYRYTQNAFIAVLVPPVDRMAEYGDSKVNAHDLFISQKLIPFIESKFKVSKNLNDRMIIGPSLGGLAAFRIGFLTNQFGFVVSQSGSFWYVEAELDNMLSKIAHTPNLYLIDGFFETGIVKSNILLAEKLQNRGIKYTKTQTPSGHNWLSWRNQLPAILNWFVVTH